VAGAVLYVVIGAILAPLVGVPLAAVVSLVLLVALGLHIRSRRNTAQSVSSDAGFHVVFLAFALSVILLPPVQPVMKLLFLNLDFIQARISIAASLSICALVSIFLAQRLDPSLLGDRPLRRMVPLGLGIAAGLGATWLVDTGAPGLANGLSGQMVQLDLGNQPVVFLPKEMARVVIAMIVGGALLTTIRLVRAHSFKVSAAAALASVMLAQGWAYADFQLMGPQTWTYPVSFAGNNYFNAPANSLHPPTASEIETLRAHLETDQYRSVIMAAPDGFPTYDTPTEHGYVAYLGQNWQLRLVDGYPILPARLALLPWPPLTRSARSVSFRSDTQLPWTLLAVLNVKYAVTVSPQLYFDAGAHGELAPDELTIEQNPLKIAPRAFLAESVRSVPPIRVPDPPPATSPPHTGLVPFHWSVVEDPRISASRAPQSSVLPKNVTARPVSQALVGLSWSPADLSKFYRIEQKTFGEPEFHTIITTEPGVDRATVSGLQALTPYTFRVRACGVNMCDNDYAQVAATTLSSLDPAELKGVLPMDPVHESIVEGLGDIGPLSNTGAIRVTYAGDRVEIDLDSSPSTRFLVLNELYHPRWKAFADGQELMVYPTNVVMRGVVVPPNVTHVQMRFIPFLSTPLALALAIAGMVITGATWFVLRRH